MGNARKLEELSKFLEVQENKLLAIIKKSGLPFELFSVKFNNKEYHSTSIAEILAFALLLSRRKDGQSDDIPTINTLGRTSYEVPRVIRVC